MASIGHIKDLPSKGLGVDVQNNFEPEYEIIPDTKKRNNKKIVADLKKTAKGADAIYLAADPDREGEAICQHLAEEIVPKKPPVPAFRVMFNEITKRAVQAAFEHPKQIDATWSMRNRRAAYSIVWWVTRFRRCFVELSAAV
jgi:DNA topoisomerase-1